MMTTGTLGRSEVSERSGITLEGLLFGATVALGAGIRLLGLAGQPLSPLEAANAWSAWLQAAGLADLALTQGVEGQTSALLHSLQMLLFWLAGGGDAPARLIPALAGIGMVALPWFWRPWLGRIVALVLAFLIAVDPWLVAFSRRADGTALAFLLFMLLFTLLVHLHRTQSSDGQQRRLWAALAVSSGLYLTSGALAFSLLPVLLFFVAVYGLPVGVSALKDSLSAEPMSSDPERGSPMSSWFSLIALFGVGLLLGSTAWLSNPQGLAAVGNSVGMWVRQFGVASAYPYPFTWVSLRFVADGLLALLLGGAGIRLLWRNRGPAIHDRLTSAQEETGQEERRADVDSRRRWALFLTLWVVWGIVLLLLPGRSPSSLLVVSVALLFAAAHFVGTLIEAYPADMEWTEAAIALAVAVVLIVAGLFWLRILIVSPGFSSRVAAICLLVFAALLLLLAAFGVWAGWRYARWLGGLLVTVLLLAANLSSLVQLNHINEVTLPDGLFAQETHPDVRRMRMNVATLSAQRIGDPGEIPIQVQKGASIDPVLGWYLRDMRRLDWVLAPDIEADAAYAPLAITASVEDGGSIQAAATDSYLGAEYAVRTAWQPSTLYALPVVVPEPGEQTGAGDRLQVTADAYWVQRIQPTLRWLLFREAKAVTSPESVILWVPSQ
jgi:hypothetical protein